MASLSAMPFLVMNLGAEMIFILEQRLQAQNVTKEKSTRVMQDVLTAMFAPHFLDELMRPQPLYTSAGIREIFDNLAQASIMRLSENSMEKLYELMITGTKQAFVTARHPNDLIEVTLNHFDSLRLLVGDGFAPVAAAAQRFESIAAKLSIGQLADVQKTLLTFFSAKKIKVTLFLQEKLQNTDGSFNIQMNGPLYQHPAVELPGEIRYFAAGGQTVASIASFLPAGNSGAWTSNPRGNATACNPFIASQRTTTLGRNIFLTERKKDLADSTSATPAETTANLPDSAARSPVSGEAPASLAAAAAHDPKLMRTKDVSPARLEETRFQGSFVAKPGQLNTTTAGLNSLAGLVGHHTAASSAATAARKDTFKISNLFGEDDGDVGAAGSDTINLPMQQVVRITAGADLNAEIKGVMNGFDATKSNNTNKKPKTDEEDLLEFLDS